jgi:phospholipid-binding lipoprotein MlaA
MTVKYRDFLLSLPGWVVLLSLLVGCATPPPADDPDAVAEFEQNNDPIEPTNRAIFDFNNWVYDNLLTPLALGYRAVVPRLVRRSVLDFLGNLKSPIIFANDLLQGNTSRALVTFERFALNTTFGVGGAMDVATPLGLPGHVADVGETLAVWGVGEGFYLVLPLFPPSNPRDAIGIGVQGFFDPLTYYLVNNHMRWVSITRSVADGLTTYEANLDTLQNIERTSLDYYSALRSLVRQHRQSQINDARLGVVAPDALGGH